MLGEMRDLVEKRKAQEATGADVSHLGPPELVYGYNDRCGTSLTALAGLHLQLSLCLLWAVSTVGLRWICLWG